MSRCNTDGKTSAINVEAKLYTVRDAVSHQLRVLMSSTMTMAKIQNKMTVSRSPVNALVVLAAAFTAQLPVQCYGRDESENGTLRTKRIQTPKDSITELLSSDRDMEDLWERASRIAKKEMDAFRLLRSSLDFSMSMPSEDMPSGDSPARPPVPRPTEAPNPSPIGPTSSPGSCLMGRTREEFIFDVLTPITDAEILNDPDTPQGMAFDYLANDDPALEDPCSSDTIEQRYGLTAFYFSTQGAEWTDNTGWLGEGNECTWFGVTCGNDTDSVLQLVLQDNNLVGSIVDELKTLEGLVQLDVYSNSLTGTLPSGLSELTDLILLDLEQNILTGSGFPEFLFELESLVALRISNNLFTGTVSKRIGNLQNLEQMWAATNQLEGSIPTQFAAASKMKSILLYENELTGQLPSELGQLEGLADLLIQSNKLQGTIPVELFQSTDLQRLRLDFNFFSGTLPPEIGDLVNLIDLRLDTNSLEGKLPSEIGQLVKLESFIINNNFLSGTVPDVFDDFERLEFFDISNAQFEGSIPESIFAISTLRIAYLSNNTLTGTIPEDYANAPKLRDLFLDGNDLTGTVPPIADGQLQQLTEFLVQFNALSGSMPESICDLRSGQLEDVFADCGGSDPEIECDFPTCCNRCFEGGNAVTEATRRLEVANNKGRRWRDR